MRKELLELLFFLDIGVMNRIWSIKFSQALSFRICAE